MATGQAIGYRPSTSGKGGTWIAKFNDTDSSKRSLRSLGDFGHLPPSERFGAATKEAREWMLHLSAGGSTEALTVREVCERYAKNKPDAGKYFTRHVYDDPIAKVLVHKLTDRQVRAWRDRLEATPAQVSRNKVGPRVTRERTTASVNRVMTPFRAALNMALTNGEALTANAWRGALKPAQAEGRRTLYLGKEQRRALLKELPADAEAFCRGLCLLPLRPGALAEARVSDFDSLRGTLVISRDKAGAGRSIVVPKETADLLRQHVKGKLPAAFIFMRAAGGQWNKDAWKKPITEAVQAADLPSGTTAYTLRHSAITDLVTSGLDLFTVAQLAGTSVRMIEKHYGHLQQEHATAALSTLAL
ncbi:site-specific integrase [Pseudoxanthomonas helianthi]|uniref:Site-specific integrase n=1 Tax=Pseudoxanthomonas helianthi TaxID=1453541 RepID=A0A941AXE1_9GAMM|nr:site-specific integrase [Pseudoxanthomonas helianthi]MBP3984783.1 site-specific integrase [Pseudoxanthomonas helianthi]